MDEIRPDVVETVEQISRTKTTTSSRRRDNHELEQEINIDNKQLNTSTENRDKELVDSIENSVKYSGGKKPKIVDYEATVTLPSRGLLYDTKISEVTLRGMTTREEKLLFASNGGDVFKKILKNCIISPRDLDVNKLMPADEAFLILQLRMITYGNDYRVEATCPKCGKTNQFTINLSEFEITYLDESFTEPIYVELRNGDILGLKLLRSDDNEFIDKYSRKFASQFNLDFGEVRYICEIARHITSINDKPIDFIDAKEYVENMVSYDSAKIRTAINKNSQFGVSNTCHTICPNCSNTMNFSMPFNSEFFRPVIE